MGMKVIGDLAHHPVIGPTVHTEYPIGDGTEVGQHVLHFNLGRFVAVLLPHHHGDSADLAVGHPARVVLEVPLGDAGGFAQLAGPGLSTHRVYTLTVDPTGTEDPADGDVETTVVPPGGPYGPPGTSPRADSAADALDGAWPTSDGTVTGFGPRDTWTVTVEPNGWGPAEGSGAEPTTWPVGTVEE